MINKESIKKELIYVYNPCQAKWMANNGAMIFRIGQGNKGDICLSFEKTEQNIEIYNKWLSIQTPKIIN